MGRIMKKEVLFVGGGSSKMVQGAGIEREYKQK